MDNNQLFLAMSDMMKEFKTSVDANFQELKSDVQELKSDVQDLKSEVSILKTDVHNLYLIIDTELRPNIQDLQTKVNNLYLITENETRPKLSILAENYLPAATRYEKSMMEQEKMKSDIEVLKKVTAEHSKILHKIS